MSRGLGRVQQQILLQLCKEPERWLWLGQLKERVWGRREQQMRGGRPTTLNYSDHGRENHHFSFRRALDSLVTAGLVETRREQLPWVPKRRRLRIEYKVTDKGLSVYFQLCTLTEGSPAAA